MSEQRRTVMTRPENSETPLDEVRSWVTPSHLFFVRNHFDVPSVDRSNWVLELTGCMNRQLTFSWDQIESSPQRSLCATMECAGKGRSFSKRPSDGVQWGRVQ